MMKIILQHNSMNYGATFFNNWHKSCILSVKSVANIDVHGLGINRFVTLLLGLSRVCSPIDIICLFSEKVHHDDLKCYEE